MGDEDLSPELRRALAIKELGDFEGLAILRSTIEIPGAAGGLRDALKFDPVTFHHGDEVVLVMKCRVTKVRFDPIKDTDALSRAHVLVPLEDLTTFVDETLVKEMLDEQRERVRLLKEQAAGINRLVDTNPDGSAKQPEGDDEMDEAEALTVHHNQGLHGEERADGCPLCEDEIAAEDAEARADAGDPPPPPTSIAKARGSRKKAGT